MKAVKFDEVNVIYAENQEEYESLPVFKPENDEYGLIVACFELSPDELKSVSENGKIWLSVLTFNNPLQPVLLSAHKPFEVR